MTDEEQEQEQTAEGSKRGRSGIVLLLPSGSYLPKMTQSPCDVPMKSNKGNESQALVREAMKACRASSGGAAGPVPAVAAIIRLLFGQIMPHTLSIITMPYAPPMPIE